MGSTENSKYLDDISRKYDSPCRVWMGPNLYIFISDAECAEQVLKGRTTLSKPKVYESISDALGGDGLFSSNGNFSLNTIKTFFHIVQIVYFVYGLNFSRSFYFFAAVDIWGRC